MPYDPDHDRLRLVNHPQMPSGVEHLNELEGVVPEGS